ncbi:4030_t:CDS:2, partial [Cetraspora pellucida]
MSFKIVFKPKATSKFKVIPKSKNSFKFKNISKSKIMSKFKNISALKTLISSEKLSIQKAALRYRVAAMPLRHAKKNGLPNHSGLATILSTYEEK